MADKPRKPAPKKPDPASVPLGSGLASRARRALSGRGRQIDEIVESQVKRR